MTLFEVYQSTMKESSANMALAEKTTKLFSGWWRFTEYEFDGYIRPTKNAILVKYNPWDDYDLAGQKRKGGGLQRPPYLSLVDFADANTPHEPEWKEDVLLSIERMRTWWAGVTNTDCWEFSSRRSGK